ncbi:hypothetical protein IWX50DRAFT_616338 [Phyllosticta citricarpa]
MTSPGTGVLPDAAGEGGRAQSTPPPDSTATSFPRPSTQAALTLRALELISTSILSSDTFNSVPHLRVASRMPPALSEDEASASETEIPYKEVDKRTKKKQPANAESEDDEDNEDEDEIEYAVEKVMSHIFEDSEASLPYQRFAFNAQANNVQALCQFEDRTWEPRENLMEGDEPIEELKEYWKKKCGGVEPKYIPKKERKQAEKGTNPGPGTKKRKLDQSAQSTPAGKETKGRRKSGRGQDADASSKEEAVLPTREKESDALPPGSWETQIASIDTIIQEPNAKTGTLERYCYVSWTDGSKNRRTKHPLPLLKQKCPHKLIEYFVQHLVFHPPRPSPEPNGDADTQEMLKSDIFMDTDE